MPRHADAHRENPACLSVLESLLYHGELMLFLMNRQGGSVPSGSCHIGRWVAL